MRRYTVLALIVLVVALVTQPLHAQQNDASASEEPSDSLHRSWFYHFLFDSTLQSIVPQKIGSAENVFGGGFTVLDLTTGARAVYDESSDSEHHGSVIDIRCSDGPQYAEIERLTNDTVQVLIYERERTSGQKRGAPLFDHTFDATHTKQIRIHLMGGDDYAIVRGNVESSIDVAVIGGAGSDELVDSSHVSGYFWHITPFPRDQKKTYFFGEPNETNFIYSSSTVIDSKPSIYDDSLAAQPLVRDWGSAIHYYPSVAASSDLGAFIGAGISLIDYDFRESPYHQLFTLEGGYATTPGDFVVALSDRIPNVASGNLLLMARASSLDVLNFFGYGNTTTEDKNIYSSGGYRLHQDQYSLSGEYSYDLLEHTTVRGMAAWRYVTTQSDPINDSSVVRKRYLYGIGPMTTVRLGASIAYDSRDNLTAPSGGIYAAFTSLWTPEIVNNTYAYTSLRADIRGYLSSDALVPFTLALRMNAFKLFGEHPFYEAAFIGGANSLRGYYADRFAGEESILASADLRIHIADLDVLVPSSIGILGFFDAGRVYIDNDFSTVWHTSFGGGLWVAPVSRDHTVTLTIGHSSEATQFYLGTGFAF